MKTVRVYKKFILIYSRGTSFNLNIFLFHNVKEFNIKPHYLLKTKPFKKTISQTKTFTVILSSIFGQILL